MQIVGCSESINSIAIIKFKYFEITVGGIRMQFRRKDLNNVLDKFFTQDCDFPDYEDIKYVCIKVGRANM